MVEREAVYVTDPATFWLTVMNVALGAAVILCLLATAVSLFLPDPLKGHRTKIG